MDVNIALITGAAQGLGKAFSEALLQKGYKVVLSDIDIEKGTKTTNAFLSEFGPDRVAFKQCNVASTEEMIQLFQFAESKFGRIDLFVNNAGICHEGQWETMIDVNLKGSIHGMKLAMQHMSKLEGGNGGHIINMCSAAGVFATPFLPVYSATKHGILAYARSISRQVRHTEKGVRITCLCPFNVDTEMGNYNEERVCGLAIANMAVKATGVLQVREVVDVFLRVLENTDGDSEALVISKRGTKIATCPYSTFDSLTDLSTK